ncbi:thermolysin [Thermotomaculum hydrothermale]|uniref:Neutral metalloproteinase n=1 Tax=Thermotomaculum hydrothermale TaxID=981385 RepID=A0A7R6PN51_9BACT|nr:M4 family metallopeptidase [Thermotomaculum hydrothermale]BBB32648.1 thermolysin [Thermotomaculum hydrothermale]
MKKFVYFVFTFVFIFSTLGFSKGHYFNYKANGKNVKAMLPLEVEFSQKRILKTGKKTHIRFSQTYHGIEVFGGELIKHYNGKNLESVNGIIFENINVGTVPVLSNYDATKIVVQDLNNPEYKIRNTKLVIFPKNDVYYLAYKVDSFKFDSNMIYFVDAETGTILFKYENVKEGKPSWVGGGSSTTLTDVTGTGIGVNGETYSDLHVVFDGSSYQMINRTRGAEIKTYKAVGRSLPGNIVTDDDNYWTDSAAVCAHKYLEDVYDFYYTLYGRKSYDDMDSAMIATVHYGTNYVNAYWNGQQMVFGDGDGVQATYLSGALDVVAHELSHAVTDYTSDLIYSNESGALNEAFSDIMGTCVEFYFQPEGFGLLKADYWMGEDIWYPNEPFGDALRYLDDPTKAGDPCHYDQRYTGTQDNGGVHINSTIVSHWFYLIAHGGTNPYSGIKVDGMGLDKARDLVFNAFTNYMPADADFSVARQVTLQTAAEMYGENSTEYNIVQTGWDAVGVY